MSKSTNRPRLADRLKAGLVEGTEFAMSKKDLQTTVIPVGKTLTGDDVVAIRTRRHMSQVQFARLLAVNVKTVQSWEQGIRVPSKPTMRLLQIVDSPEEFLEVLTKTDKVG